MCMYRCVCARGEDMLNVGKAEEEERDYERGREKREIS